MVRGWGRRPGASTMWCELRNQERGRERVQSVASGGDENREWEENRWRLLATAISIPNTIVSLMSISNGILLLLINMPLLILINDGILPSLVRSFHR